MLHPAVFEGFELSVIGSTTITGWLRVALGSYCLSGVAVGERFDPYTQPAEAIAHSFP